MRKVGDFTTTTSAPSSQVHFRWVLASVYNVVVVVVVLQREFVETKLHEEIWGACESRRF